MKTSHSTLYQNLFSLPLNSVKNIVVSSTLLVGTPALAAEVLNTDVTNGSLSHPKLPSTTLPKITVTATRTPTAINNTIAQTRVIESEELQHYQGQTALDVIKHQPGFSFYSNGGTGTSGNFYLRGYDNKGILVLIDGVRYSALSGGGASLNLLPAEQIERIEVLYGASGSSIYGADAMGGVIQIFTKGAEVDQSHFSVTAGAGSHDHYLYGATAQLSNGQGTSLSLSASHNETDGFSAVAPDGYGYNPDDDGFDSDNYSLHLNQKVTENLKVGVSGLYSESTTEFDNGVSNGKDLTKANQKNGAAQAYADLRYAPDSSVRLSYGQSIDESENPTYQTNYDTKQHQVNLVGNHSLATGKVIYGAEYLKQELDSNQYQVDDRKVASGFLGYLLSHDNFDAQANVRYDDYSDYDSETTYNFGAAYHLTPDLRLGANYAKGYRVPTFNDLYYPGSGNPNLKPETSDNYEAFIEYLTPMQSTRITGYHNKVDDILTFVSKFDDKGNYISGSVQNIDKAKIEGITLTSDWFVDDYLFGLSYDYQKAQDDGGKANDGNFLAIRPEHKGLVYIGYQLPSLDIRAEYQYVDDYFYNIGNTSKVDSYSLVNISGNYQLSPSLTLSARLNNVLNEKYVTAPGYNTDGTNFFTSLTYTFK